MILPLSELEYDIVFTMWIEWFLITSSQNQTFIDTWLVERFQATENHDGNQWRLIFNSFSEALFFKLAFLSDMACYDD